MGVLQENVASLTGDRLRERLGQAGLPAVVSRAWLGRCLAEVGAFAEASTHGEEAAPPRRGGRAPKQLYRGVSRGRFSGPPPEEPRSGHPRARTLAWALPGVATRDSGSPRPRRPWAMRMPGPAVSPRPCHCWSRRSSRGPRWGLGAVRRCGWAMWARPICWRATGRRRTRCGACPRPRPCPSGAGARGVGPAAPRRDRRPAGPPGDRAGHPALPAGAGSGRGAGDAPTQAHCHRGLGTLYAATGQREQARAELSTAIEMYQTMEMTFWLPETEAALAQVAGHSF